VIWVDFGQRWAILDHLGYLGHFHKCTGPGAPGAQSDEYKVKYDLNNQMSAYMVQENQ